MKNPGRLGGFPDVRGGSSTLSGWFSALAVVDATLPDYAFIARALKDTLPIGSIIVLKGSHRSQDIGQCCWTGCEFLKSKSMGHAWFSARSAKPAAGGTDSLSSRCGRPPRWHCTCRESPCDQENTRCWKMTVARGSEMKAQIEPLMETDCR
jgi:hypothetical protein